jgi:hypothetical protein
MKSTRLWLLALLAAGVGRAQVTSLSGNLTVDNNFTVYISTADNVTGTLVSMTSGGSWWADPGNFTAALTPNVVNYLHVVATDGGSPQGFIGSFSLSDTGFSFTNGSQLLLTTPSEFQMSVSGFGGGYVTPTSLGLNGVGPWGTFATINSSAQWLDFPGSGTGYFSTQITPIPEPASAATTLALCALGAARVCEYHRRRQIAGKSAVS